MKRVISLLVCVIVLGICGIMAQAPVQWRMSVRMSSADEGELVLKAYIEPGWHLYGTSIPQGGPKATSFNFEACRGIRLTGTPKPSIDPVTKHDDMFDLTLTYWARNVDFRVPFTITDRASLNLEATVSFMGCDDRTCLPPQTVTLKARVPVTARSGK